MNDTDTLGTGAALKKDGEPAPLKENSRSSRLRHRLRNVGAAVASIAAVGAAIGGLTGYWNAWKVVRTEIFHENQSLQQNAASRPDIVPRLSLIVLPFANLNNDPEQDYFADGITTDLTTDLGQMPGAFVIGRGTAFTYKNKHVDLRTLGKELAIRWAVQGAVQRSGDHVRVNVFLTDLSTGGDFWSDRFDGERSNLAGLQDQIVARLARSLSVELIEAEGHLREYAEAIDECRRSINLFKAFWYAYPDLVVAYSETGQLEQARQALADLYQVRPEFTVQRFQQLAFTLSSNPQFRKEFTEILVEGMRKAGVREQ